MLRVNGNPEKKFWINFNLGVQLCMLTSAMYKVEDTEHSPYNYNKNVDLTSDIKPLDYTIVASLEFNFRINKNAFLFSGFRFDRSLYNNAKASPYPYPPLPASHNTTFGIELGIKQFLNLKT